MSEIIARQSLKAVLNSGARIEATLGPGAVIMNDYVLAVSDIDGGHRLTISRGSDVQTLDVLDGKTGPAGFAPTVEVETIAGGHRVTITDANGSQSFEVLDGVGGSGEGGLSEIPVATQTRIGGIRVGGNLRISAEGVLSVDTTDDVAQDNTRPITSAGVYAEVGNINALLASI